MAFPAPVVAEPVVMRFGKHHGRPIASVDDGYLYWAVRRAWVSPETKRELRAELRRRAPRRRSWRPVVKVIFGRELLDVTGKGPFAVVQPCGVERRELTVVLYDSAALAWEQRLDYCGFDGPYECYGSRHYVVDLGDWSRVPGEAIE